MNKNTKNNLFYLIVFIIYFLIALILGNIFVNVPKQVMNIPNFNTPAVIIDAGHGGEDGGAIGIDGITLEKDINLSIAKKLNDALRNMSISTFMVREEDRAIYKSTNIRKTLRQKKVEDLQNRVALANSNNGNILVSIHQNKFTDESLTGTQIFYSGNNKNSATLANFVKEEFTGAINEQNCRENKKSSKKIYLLKKATVPAIIVECGFMSNKEELRKLTSEDYQNTIAESISKGIKKFLNRNNN